MPAVFCLIHGDYRHAASGTIFTEVTTTNEDGGKVRRGFARVSPAIADEYFRGLPHAFHVVDDAQPAPAIEVDTDAVTIPLMPSPNEEQEPFAADTPEQAADASPSAVIARRRGRPRTSEATEPQA